MAKSPTTKKSVANTEHVLAEVSRVVLSTLDFDSIFSTVVDSLRFALDYLHVALFEVDAPQQKILLRAQAGDMGTPLPRDFHTNLNHGVLGLVARTGRPKVFIVDEHNLNTSLLHVTATEITLPIPIGNEVGSLLFLASPSGAVPSQQEIEALERLADHVGVALENARAYSALRSHDRALSTLLLANKDLFNLMDRGEILRRFAAYLFDAIPDSHIAIVELPRPSSSAEADEKEMAQVRRFFSPEALKRNQPEEEIIPMRLLEELREARRSKRVTSLSLHSSRVLPRQVAEEIHAAGASPYLVAPLIPQEQVLGFMVVHRMGLKSGFAPHEVDLAEALTNLVSLWLRNALLIEELKSVNQELAKSNELKTNLMSILSHDVKSPLHGIHGFAELMQEAAPSDPELAQATQIIMGNVKRIVAIIDDTMSVARIEAGEISLKTEPLNLGALIDEQIATHSHQCRLEKQLASDLPLVRGDKLRVMEILENLVNNSIKYTRDDNFIAISARPSEDGAKVQTTVADHGMGIPADELPKLFTRYYRIRNEQTRTIEGTGLGLYIVKLLVEAHGGHVWAESVFGKGSQFHFTLPVAKRRD